MRTTHGNALVSDVQGRAGPLTIHSPIHMPITPYTTGPITLFVLPHNQPKHAVKRPSKAARTAAELVDPPRKAKRHDDAPAAPGDPAHRPQPFPPGTNLISPDTRRADCDAWKVADHHYSINRDRLSPLYRHLWPRPHASTYDVFMKYALPHILRGLRAPDCPRPQLGESIHKMLHYTNLQARGTDPAHYLPIIRSCQCYGLHHARVWLCQARRKDPPDSPTFYLYWYILEFADYNRTPGTTFWACHRLQLSHKPNDVTDWFDWWPYTNYTTYFSTWHQRIHGIHVLSAIPNYTDDGHEIDPPQIDPDSILGVNTLTTNETHAHWPRKPKAKRGTTYWYDTSEDTRPPTPWGGYHWKPY